MEHSTFSNQAAVGDFYWPILDSETAQGPVREYSSANGPLCANDALSWQEIGVFAPLAHSFQQFADGKCDNFLHVTRVRFGLLYGAAEVHRCDVGMCDGA
ncbi:hypothetical protein C1D09_023550 [Mesorhizobium intechi]|uniref:Uncharacterized protein n=1 Tax=Mesorhizobium intechi TaxID=537601 RepID=A0A8T9AKD7_9HYPH|nr:hypothetical protein [Mesorhizobium intechi]TSE04729.1 hypothetical protein C1D09_023550 [Mesorhizobium intechi]